MATLDPSRAGLPTPPESQRAEPAAPPGRQTSTPARAAPLAPQTALTAASRPARAASSMAPWWERPPVKIYKRPVGRAPLGHEWSKSSTKTNEWTPIPNYVAPKKPVDSSVVPRPVGKPPTGHAWNVSTAAWELKADFAVPVPVIKAPAGRPPKNSKFDPEAGRRSSRALESQNETLHQPEQTRQEVHAKEEEMRRPNPLRFTRSAIGRRSKSYGRARGTRFRRRTR